MLVSEETSMVKFKHVENCLKSGGKTWMLLANKMAEVRLVSCTHMQSQDTQARQRTTVNVRTACRGFCLSGFYYVVINQLVEIPTYFLI